jgi:hypothetical protein
VQQVTIPTSIVDRVARHTLEWKIHWLLRLALVSEFVGHGAFGVLTKAAWVPYFGVVGIPEPWAWAIMPLVGSVDITLGVVALVKPMRAVLLYMTCWGLWTACLRPLAGEGVWELLERAGNFGVPLAFLALAGWPRSLTDWVATIEPPALTPRRATALAWILCLTTGLLLIGHGGIGAVMHKDWSGYFATVGIPAATAQARSLSAAVGWFEIVLGLLVLTRPGASLLAFVFAWKVATEWLRPLAGGLWWEFIERFGSFAAPLALLYLAVRSRRVEG